MSTDELALADMTHDDIEAGAAELASIMTRLYGQPYRRGDVLDLAAECTTGRSADALALGLSAVANGVREDAGAAGLSFDDLMAAAGDGDGLALSMDTSMAAAEAQRIVRDARERGTLGRGGKRSGPDLVHDFTDAEDATDDRQPARGGDDWRAEVERISRQHAAEMGSPLDALESPRGGSTTIRRKSPGEQALGRRRSRPGHTGTPLTMAEPVPQGSAATEVPAGYGGQFLRT